MSYDLGELRQGLRPIRLRFFPRLASTSDHAARLRRQGRLFGPAVVVTARQLRGRGRGANAWWSSPGCITATFVYPIEEHLVPHQIALLAGLAVRQAAVELTGADGIQLKWPNDVLHGGRKLAGVLCERIEKADLIGIGLNVNVGPADAPRALCRRITSLSAIAGHELCMTQALTTIGGRLHAMLSRRHGQPFAAIVEEYNRHHALTGCRVRVTSSPGGTRLMGTCEGLDQLGRLILRTSSGRRAIVAGHVEAA